MNATLLISVLVLLLSCGEVEKKTVTKRENIEALIASLERQIDLLSESTDSNNPIIINLTRDRDSLKASITSLL
jgi:peptidoglycan hydrolase CwlO-like protein